MHIRDRRFTLGIGIAAVALAAAAAAFALTGTFGIGPAAAEGGDDDGDRGAHHDGDDRDRGDGRAALAGALGVTVDELEAAVREVALDRIDAAVDAGRLTEERAEMLREAIESGEPFGRGRFDDGHRGRGFGFGFHGRGFDGAIADMLPEGLAERLRDLIEAVESGDFDARDFGESFGIFRFGIAGGDGFDFEERQQAMLDRIDAALEAGMLSEERADALRTLIETDDGEGRGGFGWPGRGFHRGHR